MNVSAAVKKASTMKEKVMKKSTVRLKVRNIDEKQVTNDDLKVSIKLLFPI